ncbi:MAG: hypothetical protein ACYC5Z_06230 [Acidimicrobiales bacterium]
MSDARRHVASCVEAIYRGLGESAPTFTHDAYVVCLFEVARTFGALAHSLRDAPVEPHPVIREIFARASDEPSGALSLYALSMVVGPRLLVTLADIADPTFSDVAEVTRHQLMACARLTSHPEAIDDPGFAAAARDLVVLAEASGNAESFPLAH